jgi:hypothetical protein
MDKWVLELYKEGSTSMYKSTGKKFNKAYYPFISQFANLLVEEAKSNEKVGNHLNNNSNWKKFESGFLKERMKEESAQLAGGCVEDESRVSSKISQKYNPDDDIICGGSKRSYEGENFLGGALISAGSDIIIEGGSRSKRGEEQSVGENKDSSMEDATIKTPSENSGNEEKSKLVFEQVTEHIVDSQIPKENKAKGIIFEDTEENIVGPDISSTIAMKGNSVLDSEEGEENIPNSTMHRNTKEDTVVFEQLDERRINKLPKSKEENKEKKKAEENIMDSNIMIVDSIGPGIDLGHIQAGITFASKKVTQQVPEKKTDPDSVILDVDEGEPGAKKVKTTISGNHKTKFMAAAKDVKKNKEVCEAQSKIYQRKVLNKHSHL